MASRPRRVVTAAPSSSSLSSLTSKRSRAPRSDGSNSYEANPESPTKAGEGSRESTASPPIRRRTTQTKAVPATRIRSSARAASARHEEQAATASASTSRTRQASTSAAPSSRATGRTQRNGRARQVVDSDEEEEAVEDDDESEDDFEDATDAQIDSADVGGRKDAHEEEQNDRVDAPIIEQNDSTDTPPVPAAKRARIASDVVHPTTPSRITTTPVKAEQTSPSLHTMRSPPAAIALQPPSSSPPHTPDAQAQRRASQEPAQSMLTLQTPALAMPRTPRSDSVTTAPASLALNTPGPSRAVVEPPKTRLVIHKMVLRNFKSYAGEQTIGPFHKSFSAVVGPNGSGKSNVIDAMLFVFGWRANKMRQGKLSELIHNSAGSDNIPSCTVEVWFRDIVDLPGPDDYKVVPNSRLIVARTAYKNNTSVYTLNSKKSSFTEVTTLLKGRGIDLDHKRFLILQGEVESIAQMPPKAKNEHEEGLLEYLEDIIGTSSYKTPIEESNKKVDELNDVRGERLARLKIVQKEKDSLEGKKREAETFLRDQNALATRQSSLWQIYMLECKDEIHIATTSMEKLRRRIEEETEKHSGSRAEMDELDVQFKQISSEHEKLLKEADKIGKEVARLEKEDVQLQEKRKHLETKKKKLAKTLADDKKNNMDASATFERSSEEIETLGEEVKRLESSLEKEEAELDRIREGLKGKTEGFNRAIEEKQRELQPWTAQRSEKQNAKNVALEERRLLEDQFSQAEKETDQAKAALVELQTAIEGKQDERERLHSEKVQQGKKARQYAEELKDMQTQETTLRNKAASSRAKCDDAKVSMQSNQSRGDVLNGLTRQADLGMIKGFHGRLGNLGIIDDKFDVAISTACPGLDNIVVEGVETGQACIEHLRRNNLGRANFILLNSLAKMNMGRINTPENVPRLFDLVQPRDARFAPAFYHQLRDTLVATDLAQANRIAYGATRYRVVTLDGQLIDKSGTMSGGGTRVARGAMSSKPVAPDMTLEQLSRLDKERQVDHDTLANHVKYMNEMRSLLEAAQRRVPEIDVELEKIEMDLSNSERMIDEAKRRVDNMRSRHGPDAGDLKRVAELTKQVDKLSAELDTLTQTTSAIEADIILLQEKILEVGGLELRTQKSKVDGIRERLDLLGERVTKAEVAKAKAEKDIAKLSKSSQKNEEALSTLEEELSGLKEEIAIKSEAVAAVRKQVEDSQFEMEAKSEAKDEIKGKLDACTEGMNAFRSLEVEIKQKLEDNEKSLADNEKRLHHWQDKSTKLALHHIDGDDEAEADEAAAGEKAAAAEAPEEGAGKPAEEQAAQNADVSASPELQEYSPDELRGMSKESLKAEITEFEEKLAKGHANLSVLEEYRRRENEFLARASDLDETTQERDRAKEMHDNLRKERLESFMAGFSVISAKLKEMYQTITLGGNAELELVDSLDPFSEGILFSVMPPRKSWKNISNLSGGEKTLSSLALVFALHAFKPTPLYAMDELDAALDFRNVSIVANLIKERTKGAQFIVISLRNNMFELASRLVGIYKTNGQTKSLAVHNSDLHASLAPPPQPQPPRSVMASRSSQQPWMTPRAGSSAAGMRSVAPTPLPGGSNAQQGPPPSTLRRPQPPPSVARGLSSSLTNSSLAPPPSLLTPSTTRLFGGSFDSTAPGGTRNMPIPQTPRTGNVKGLSMGLPNSVTASSIKLTSSHSIRGGLNAQDRTSHTANNSSGLPPTPLATRRAN